MTDLRAIEPILKRLLAWLSTADHAYDTAIVRARKYASTLERDREFGVVGSRVGGSIGKGTAIKPVSDVDLFLYLDEAAWQTTRGEALRPSTIIGRLHARVAQRLHFEIDAGYATIRRQGHSVGIQLRKSRAVDIDVVPALVQGGDIREARIPGRGTDAFVATSVMSTTRMRTPVVIERYYRHRPHARRACIILDPAMPDNNLGGHLDARIGDDLGTAARRSLRKLAKAAHFAEKAKFPVAAGWLSEAFGEPGLIKWDEE